MPDPFPFALAYRNLGWSVIPLKRKDKRPSIPWKDFQGRIAEKQTISNWLRDMPGSNLGIVTGEVSGLVVLDVDSPEAWEKLQYEHGIPRTPIARTAKGWHLYFRHPGFEVKNFARKRPGLDLRGDGGYVVAPPSVHPSGAAYIWEVSPREAEPAALPDWLLELLHEEEPAPYVFEGVGDVREEYAAYAEAALDRELGALARASNGARNDALNRAAFSLGTLVGAGVLDELDVSGALYRVARGIGLGNEEASKTIASGLKVGREHPRQLPERERAERNGNLQAAPVAIAPMVVAEIDPFLAVRPGGSTWEDMEQVIAPISWTWDGWLPNGLITMIAAVSGTGKSVLALRLCASIINGVAWPDGREYEGETGRVLWCEAEAAQALNLERAREWGLPMSAFQSPLDNPLDDVQLDNPEHRASVLAWASQPDIKLIVIDSLSGAHPYDETSAEAREIMKWLAELSRNTGKPVLIIHHLRKRGATDSNTQVDLERVRGGSALVQTPRVIWALDVPDESDKEHKRLSVIKNNLARFPAPLGLRIQTGAIEFDAAPEPPRKDTLRGRAEDLILAILHRNGGTYPSAELIAEVEEAGISKYAAHRAKDSLGIIATRIDNRWLWSLPVPSEDYVEAILY